MHSHYLPLCFTQRDPKTSSHVFDRYGAGACSGPGVGWGSPTSCSHLALLSPQTLCRGGWNASFEELHDVDHFEIIWKLTQKDYVLTQVGHVPSSGSTGPASVPPCPRAGGRAGST